MSFGIEDVKRLREETGAGMLDCKKALTEADGDFEKARDILRKKGLAAVAKRAVRSAEEGIVAAALNADKDRGALVSLMCETDFVARTEDFTNFASLLAQSILAHKSDDLTDLMKKSLVDSHSTIEDALNELSAKLGEKIVVSRAVLFPSSDENVALFSYIHHSRKIGVLLGLKIPDTVNKTLLAEPGKLLAMQVAAARPLYLNPEEIPSDVLEREKAVYREQAIQTGKPEAVVEKIVNGKLQKFFREVCFLEQEFLMDPNAESKSVQEYVSKSVSAKAGGEVEVFGFRRVEIGESNS
ncbi:MAG: elongation factor Ts [Candidatus Hydrogenedentota bacterium]|nr:MAG: elongation factor Ts [Candidatus Hydrogenedentota bacterium]